MTLKIDTPVMFTTHKIAYRLYSDSSFQDYTTLESAKYMQSLSGGEVSQVTLVGRTVVQEIPYET